MLFSAANNVKMEEVRNYIAISSSMKFEHVEPHIDNAERDFIKPLLGDSLYAELQDFYDIMPVDNPTEVQIATKELLQLVQRSLIHLAYWIGFDFLNVEVSDSGFRRIESDKVKGLYRYQEENLRAYFKTNGFNGLDDALEFIDENIVSFNEFKLSPNWTQLKQAFIPDTKTFDGIYGINNSRLTFLRLKQFMKINEDFEIKKALGETIYNYMKAQMVLDAPEAKAKALLPYIQKPLAYLSVADLMLESGADLSEKGLYFSQTVSTTNNDTEVKPADKDRVVALANKNRLIGSTYLEALKRYLVDHADDWPDYSQQTGSVFTRDNTDKKTFWA